MGKIDKSVVGNMKVFKLPSGCGEIWFKSPGTKVGRIECADCGVRLDDDYALTYGDHKYRCRGCAEKLFKAMRDIMDEIIDELQPNSIKFIIEKGCEEDED